jgi:DNA mismatch repair protein MutL
VRGFVGPTNVHRANRGYITLFINGRWVEDLRLTYAIIQAYHTLLPVKRYPVAFVLIDMPTEDVDVNVHPTKSEVRFRDGDAVFRAVQRAVRATVVDEAPTTVPLAPEGQSGAKPSEQQIQRARLAALRPAQGALRFTSDETEVESSQRLDREDNPSSQLHHLPEGGGAQGETPSGSSSITGGRKPALPPLRIIGQAATMFIIAEGPDGVYLIDQHAAHERILYERMLLDRTRGDVPRQPLLEPEVVALPVDEADQLEEMVPALSHLGLDIEPFGPNTFLVRAVPAQLKHLAAADLLADIAATAGECSPVEEELEEIVIRHICKRAAVKAGQVLAREEMDQLIRDLERTRNPRTCPHGRPTVVQISTEELVKHFGRGG